MDVKEQRNLAKQLGVKMFSTLKNDQLKIVIAERKKELQILLKQPDKLCSKCGLERIVSEMMEKIEQSRCITTTIDDIEIDVSTGEVIRPCIDNFTKDYEYR